MMKRLLSLLSSLRKNELSQVRSFLDSPFHNTNRFIRELFAYLRKFYPDFSSPRLELDYLRVKLLQDRDTHPTYLEDRIAELCRLLEEFLVIRQVQTDKRLRREARWQTFTQRKLFKEVTKMRKDILQDVQREDVSPWSDPFPRWYWSERLFTQLETAVGKIPSPGMDQIMYRLDDHYIVSKLMYICELLSRQKTYQEEHNFLFFEPLLEEAKRKQEDHPKIYIYYKLIQMFIKDLSEDQFLTVKNWFTEKYKNFDKFEKLFIVVKLIGVASKHMFQSNYDYMKEVALLYQFGIEKDLLPIAGKISDRTFINVCTSGASAGEFEWTERFIDHEGPKLLDLEKKEETILVGRIYFLFHSGKYELASELLNDFPSSDVRLKFRINTLCIRCYFELYINDYSYEGLLFAKLNSFKKFIKRNKSHSESRKKAYSNFIEAVRQLLKFQKAENKDYERLIRQIEKNKPITSSNWLKSKALHIYKNQKSQR
ncbi:MAG: hypothetical protein AAFV95_15305 [Bacteroidota bacterium]